MNNLQEILNSVKSNGFSDLHVVISVEYVKSKDAYFSYERNERKYHIEADKKMKKAPLEVVEGGLAHELAHIERDSKLGFFERREDIRKYNDSAEYRKEDERETDMLVIQKGYGKQLLEFIKYHNKRRRKYKKKDGLTKKEIKKLIK